MHDYIITGDNVRVEWKSATGNHSCEFGVDWLKDYDYTTPGIHDKRRKEETPLITVSCMSPHQFKYTVICLMFLGVTTNIRLS